MAQARFTEMRRSRASCRSCRPRRTSATRNPNPIRSCCSFTERCRTPTSTSSTTGTIRPRTSKRPSACSGREAEIWHADTGAREPAAYRIAGDRTTVPVHLDPWDAVFVVFRKAAAAPSRTIAVSTDRGAMAIVGPWTVRFPPNRGAPETITLGSLQSWSDHADTGVKYFSGTAVYTRSIDVPADFASAGDPPVDRSRRCEESRRGRRQRQPRSASPGSGRSASTRPVRSKPGRTISR